LTVDLGAGAGAGFLVDLGAGGGASEQGSSGLGVDLGGGGGDGALVDLGGGGGASEQGPSISAGPGGVGEAATRENVARAPRRMVEYFMT
jgi:hypothetical protein